MLRQLIVISLVTNGLFGMELIKLLVNPASEEECVMAIREENPYIVYRIKRSIVLRVFWPQKQKLSDLLLSTHDSDILLQFIRFVASIERVSSIFFPTAADLLEIWVTRCDKLEELCTEAALTELVQFQETLKVNGERYERIENLLRVIVKNLNKMLCKAIKTKNEALVTKFVQLGADCTLIEEGVSTLHRAAYTGKEAIIATIIKGIKGIAPQKIGEMLQAKAEPEIHPHFGITPLDSVVIAACSGGEIGAVNIFLQIEGYENLQSISSNMLLDTVVQKIPNSDNAITILEMLLVKCERLKGLCSEDLLVDLFKVQGDIKASNPERYARIDKLYPLLIEKGTDWIHLG